MMRIKKMSLVLLVVATAMVVVSYRLISTSISSILRSRERTSSPLDVHVPIFTAQKQNWTKYLLIRNALEEFFSPRVRMVRATTPADSLKSCLKDAARREECSAITPIRHYSTCTLVGNSGILLNSSCGYEIDTHDFVIRFNLGPLQDYSKDVGRKVNMTVINYTIVRKLFPMFRKNQISEALNLLKPFNNSVLLLAKGAGSTKFLKDCKSMENMMRGRGLNLTIALSNFNGSGTDQRLWSGLGGKLKSIPTTGLLLLGEAITFCDHVTMYGFYPFNKDHQNHTVPYHYWRDFTDFPSKTCTPHRFMTEYKLLGALINDGIMNHTLDCNVIEGTTEHVITNETYSSQTR